MVEAVSGKGHGEVEADEQVPSDDDSSPSEGCGGESDENTTDGDEPPPNDEPPMIAELRELLAHTDDEATQLKFLEALNEVKAKF